MHKIYAQGKDAVGVGTWVDVGGWVTGWLTQFAVRIVF